MNVWDINALTFSKVLKERRKEKGFTQNELATKADVNPITIFNYENDYKVPKLDTLVKVASALGIDEIRIDTHKKWRL